VVAVPAKSPADARSVRPPIVPPAGRETVKCPVCGSSLGRVEKHFRKVHPDRMDLVAELTGCKGAPPAATPATSIPRPKSKPGSTAKARHLTIPVLREGRVRVVRCPLCRISVQPLAIWEHVDHLHPGTDYTNWQVAEEGKHRRGAQTNAPRATDNQKPSKPASKSKPQDWIEGLAAALTRATRVAGGSKSLNRAPVDARRKKFRTHDRVEPAVRREWTADATRLYADRYRERGRFGSHAAHDGYGDEHRA
jgi:hypothetical protein